MPELPENTYLSYCSQLHHIMMFWTHALAGGSLGLFLSFLTPGMQLPLITAGMLAGVIPDLDMFLEHRKTFHRPIEFTLLFITSVSMFLITGSHVFLILLVFSGSISLHVFSEVLGQGKTMNPDLKEDDRCVYNHLNGEWIKPMRIIKVGSLKDLSLSMLLSLPLLLTRQSLIVGITALTLLSGVIQFILADWITKNLLSDYGRFSEAIQYKIGYGPEVKN